LSIKTVLLALLTALCCISPAQGSLFDTVKPDVLVIVREHKTGADLVQITLVKSDYPKELLRQQINTLGAELGSDPRGVSIIKKEIGAGQSFLRAEFGVDGLIERDLPALRLEPIIRAFAGAEGENEIHGINVMLDDIVPVQATVLKWDIPDVLKSEARFIPVPRGIEYRIQLLSQDPAKITFPEKIQKSNETTPDTTSEPRDNRVLIISLFCIVGLALGALVYFAMLRGGSRKDSKTKR
jgi:hypothetical protein